MSHNSRLILSSVFKTTSDTDKRTAQCRRLYSLKREQGKTSKQMNKKQNKNKTGQVWSLTTLFIDSGLNQLFCVHWAFVGSGRSSSRLTKWGSKSGWAWVIGFADVRSLTLDLPRRSLALTHARQRPSTVATSL